jgi:acetylornithine deacetylase
VTATPSDLELFSRLVAFDTTSHRSNREAAAFIASVLDRPGVRISEIPSADGEKANLVVEVGPEPDENRRGLALSAHMDVVPAGEGWATDPFTLTDGGDRWLGRGSADMKGFLALAVGAAAREDPRRLAAPLVLVLTYDEELGCLGAQRLAETWPEGRPLPQGCVVGEPTSLRAVRLHKGHSKLRLTLHGTAAHSGYPHLGHNAIEPAGRVIVALAELRQELAAERPRHGEHFPETPFVALNVGRVAGGTAINVVPERCTIELGFRLLPEMDPAPVVRRVTAAVERAAAGERYEIEALGDAPPLFLPAEAPIYRAVAELIGQRETLSASYATDAGWLQRLGLDCVVFGPGTIEVAHKPDEWIPKGEFAAAAVHLQALVGRFCREQARGG